MNVNVSKWLHNNKIIIFSFLLTGCTLPAWGITSSNKKFILEESDGGLTLSHAGVGTDIPLIEIICDSPTKICESAPVAIDYDMVMGKRKHCSNRKVEGKYLLSDGDTLFVRLYDDGLAWKRKGISTVRLLNPQHYWIQEWTDCYENFFPKDVSLSEDKRFGYPLLVEYPRDIFGLLTESAITPREVGVSMYPRENFIFELKPDGPENGGWQTYIGGTLADIVESTLVTDNSEDNRIGDPSWVMPGVAAWVYWAYNHGSNDYEIIKKYVDLAVDLKLPYILIDAEWDEMKDGKTVEDAVEYALSKGVLPMIWYNSSVGWVNGAPGPKYRLNTPESMEKEFAWCEKIGVKGVKIDFFSGDTNLNMRFMSELLESAARHHLLVNFHGAPLPRGWQRTYPNLITTEAVYGAEWYNNVPTFTDKAASHNATLPFTRNVIASMDYTPCAFSDSQHPHITTHGHELALTALFESGIQHLADRPESLLAQPEEVKAYFSSLPAAWDETILLDGYPGEFVAMARKSGEKWWISIINGTNEMINNKKIDYSRLSLNPQSIKGRLFEDCPIGSENPWRISEVSSLPIEITLLPRGGLVMVIE